MRQHASSSPSRASRAPRSFSEVCSRTFREPSVSGRAPGAGHAGSEAHKLRGKVVVCQCACWEISSPPSSAPTSPPVWILICLVIHLTGEMKCCRAERCIKLKTLQEERVSDESSLYIVYHEGDYWGSFCGTVHCEGCQGWSKHLTGVQLVWRCTVWKQTIIWSFPS